MQQQNLRDSQSQTQANAEQRLQAYLKALEKPLASVKTEVRQEWISEAELHLRSLIDAYEEMGRSHEEAVTAAMQRFGDARRVARRMRLELFWQEQMRPTPRMRNLLERMFFKPFAPLTYLLALQAAFLHIPLLNAWGIYSHLVDPSMQIAAQRVADSMVLVSLVGIGWLFGRQGALIRDRILSRQHGEPQRLARAILVGTLAVTALNGGGFWYWFHQFLLTPQQERMVEAMSPDAFALWISPAYIYLHMCLNALYGLLLFLGSAAVGWRSRQSGAADAAKV